MKWTRTASTKSIAACCSPSSQKYDGGPVGLGTLAATLAEEEDALEEVYEPFLIQIGFLDRTPRGRVATRLAYEHFNRAMPGRQTPLF